MPLTHVLVQPILIKWVEAWFINSNEVSLDPGYLGGAIVALPGYQASYIKWLNREHLNVLSYD